MPHGQYLDRTRTVEDEVTARWLADAAAVLGADVPADGCVPPLWHWMMFARWPQELRDDGGALAEGFLPPFGHLPRRMAAGGRVTFHRPLRVGERLERTSRISAIAEKAGRSGPLVVMTIEHAVNAGNERAVTEEQDVVYMVAPSAPGAQAATQQAPAAVTRAFRGDTVTLFRYSAMTANSHRIHYDLEYAREVERFPGVVVHGPLQATWLAGLAEEAGGRRLASLRYRHVGAAYNTDALEACAWQEGEGLRLALRKAGGANCTEAVATLA